MFEKAQLRIVSDLRGTPLIDSLSGLEMTISKHQTKSSHPDTLVFNCSAYKFAGEAPHSFSFLKPTFVLVNCSTLGTTASGKRHLRTLSSGVKVCNMKPNRVSKHTFENDFHTLCHTPGSTLC